MIPGKKSSLTKKTKIEKPKDAKKTSIHFSNKNVSNALMQQTDLSPLNNISKAKKLSSHLQQLNLLTDTNIDSTKDSLPLIMPHPKGKHSNSNKQEMYKVCETSPRHSPVIPTYKTSLHKKLIQPSMKHSSLLDKSKYSLLSQSLNPVNPLKQQSKVKLLPITSAFSHNAYYSNKILTSDSLCLTEASRYDCQTTIDNKTKPIYYAQSQAGKKRGGIIKENQDSYVMLDELFGFDSCYVFGVMDGHGTNGHKVSQFIKQGVIDYFGSYDTYKCNKRSDVINELLMYNKLSLKNYQCITNFYTLMEEKLKLERFDVHYSGSTCVLLYIINDKLICSNTGDSRAIIVKQNCIGKFVPEQLSRDHKPYVPSERKRIVSMGGVVQRDNDNGLNNDDDNDNDANDEDDKDNGDHEGIYRIWSKYNQGPGIAISRTIGDVVASGIGVISEPEVIEKSITDDMCYIVVASDGIWDFIDNINVMQIVNHYYMKDDPKGACNALIQEATKRWEHEGEILDDITCIVYFLRPYKGNNSNNNKM